MPLSEEDKTVLELLEKANQQYEQYLTATDVTSLIVDEPSAEPVYNWERPLTLVITAGK